MRFLNNKNRYFLLLKPCSNKTNLVEISIPLNIAPIIQPCDPNMIIRDIIHSDPRVLKFNQTINDCIKDSVSSKTGANHNNSVLLRYTTCDSPVVGEFENMYLTNASALSSIFAFFL